VRLPIAPRSLNCIHSQFFADVTYGLANFVAAEEFNRFRGFWWSPCSAYLMVERADNSSLQKWYISDPSSPHKQPSVHRYPAAGTANPALSYSIIRVSSEVPSHVPVVWDSATFEYVVTASFGSRGPLLTVMSRCQTKQLVCILTAHHPCSNRLFAGAACRSCHRCHQSHTRGQ
jgi:dipeptidyl-peptidase-4